MNHDPDLVVAGSRLSSILEMKDESGSPLVFKAGLAVGLNNQGLTLSGYPIGISMGRSLVDSKKTSVARAGMDVPLRIKDEVATLVAGDLILFSKEAGDAGNSITLTLLDVLSDGQAQLLSEDDEQDIIVGIESGVTTAQAIALALADSEFVTVEVIEGSSDAPQESMSETALAGGLTFIPRPGLKVEIDPTTGLGVSEGYPTRAYFSSGRKSFKYGDGSIVPCALVSLSGGF